MELLFIIIVHGVGADGTDAEIIFLEFGLMKTLNFQRPQHFMVSQRFGVLGRLKSW
jgi:hypothetical protein